MADCAVQLLREIAERDLRAFSLFYDRFASRVFGLILRIVRNRTDSEDVLQEVFAQVWRQADRFDPTRAAPDTWLLMIARSRAADRLRRMRRHSEFVHEFPEPRIECDPATPFAKQEAALAVTHALDGLIAVQRDPIRLSFFDGYTHEEISILLNLPLGTVKTRIRLGLRKLRERLEQLAEEATVP